ncbi:hypothetical protein [Streptomyces niveus]|uniref:hypothetical protein n=1 Tax=Streptomyces niveus TaxID=193462 RepID=UPI0003C5A73C|nr:hypothetical protein [Streptomyces niveus]EST25722.1 hypothetical protein M877_21305 [Streptomyces niveus NCIMB 11891]
MANGLTDRVGLVLVHGLFASPRTWSAFEDLIAGDPELAHKAPQANTLPVKIALAAVITAAITLDAALLADQFMP